MSKKEDGVYGQDWHYREDYVENLKVRVQELQKALQEMRKACAAAMRILSRHNLSSEYGDELLEEGIENGFGVRADDALMRKEG